MRKKPAHDFFVYFGASGTAWALLRDFGVGIQATLLLVVFATGVLLGLRLKVILDRR